MQVSPEVEKVVVANRPQGKFLTMPQKFRAYVAGFRAGKTRAGCMAMCQHFWEFPGVNQGYFAPSYSLIADIFFPSIEIAAASYGLRTAIKEQKKEVEIYSGRQYRGTILCRSMDNPDTIIGFEIGHAMIDELDVLPTNKAKGAWNKIIARMSSNTPDVRNGIDVCTTPEGFRFVHQTFVQRLSEDPERANNYGLIQASTYDNQANLPADYIPSLIEAYPKELIEAYLNGQFVNLTSGTVYRNYDRVRCGSTETIRAGEPLFIGCDFNVQNVAASVFVQRPDAWHLVAEVKDVFDTPDLIKLIDDRWKSIGHRITIYPDASGGSRKTVDASKSDISLLQQAGYSVRANRTNPAVKDRVAAANKAFERGKVKVNAQLCKWSAQCLEQQAYTDNGEPDKTAGFDHANDSLSYLIAYEMPIVAPMARMQLVGV